MNDRSVRFAPAPVELSRLRKHLSAFCAYEGISGPTRDELLLVASELCSNAIAAAAGPQSELWLTVSAGGEAVVVEVSDDGPGFSASWADAPGRQAVSGRGLTIVRALSDEVSVRSDDGRTVVQASLRLPAVDRVSVPAPVVGRLGDERPQ
jgi:anti-sigma regulatory factor (Ser/Thr protein kinase)